MRRLISGRMNTCARPTSLSRRSGAPRCDLTNPIAPQEYYLGLVAYGLAALKYPNLYEQKSARWLLCQRDQATRGDRLCGATFAAWALPQLDEVEVTGSIVARAATSAVRLLARPQVIGRDDMLAAAPPASNRRRVEHCMGQLAAGASDRALYWSRSPAA